jgi:hypothetical protein
MKYPMALILFPWMGGGASAAEPLHLQAGPVSMVFERENAFLRFVRIGKHEVLRGINAPVRNQFWGTVKPVVKNLRLESGRGKFALTFDATCNERDVDFFWTGRLTGDASGQIVFTFDGEARSTFRKNRIGFCILHGPSAAGKPWVIEDIDGKKTPGHFPTFISPHQPAKKIREIAHELAPGVWAHVRCEGDTFEMEDQRNWTDASFKTYCTPLELPYPVRISSGTKISHKVEISFKGDVSKLSGDDKQDEPVTLTLRDGPGAVHSLPAIGLKLSSQVETLDTEDLRQLKSLHLDHLRVDLTPSEERLTEALARATRQARALGVQLHVGLHLGKDPVGELDLLVAAARSTQAPVSLWLVNAADQKTLQRALGKLASAGSKALIGTGEDTHFTALNRNRPGDGAQVVSFGLNPQCHATDNLSMIESLEIQGDTIHSARQFIGDRPLVISPITLKVQKEPQAPLPGQLPSSVDARQPSLFVAGWTLGSIKYLSEGGAQGLTYYETVGWKGVLASRKGSPLPQAFATKPGEVFSVYHVLRAIGEFAGGQVREVSTTETLSVVGLALIKEGRRRLMLANLTDQPQAVKIRGLAAERAVVYRLSSDNVASANADPEAFSRRKGVTLSRSSREVRLGAHEIVRIDSGN